MGARAANQIAPRGPRDNLATYIPKLAKVPLDFQPGSLWRYSGLAGFDVLSRIVEVVSKQTFDAFLKERLFSPLGMPDTGFHFADAARARRVASMHARRDGKLEVTPRELDAVYFSGAGGLASTAEDYLQFAQMLLNGGELNGRRYLGPRTIELMRSNHTGDMVNGQFGRPAHGMGFGLGMQVVEDPVVRSSPCRRAPTVGPAAPASAFGSSLPKTWSRSFSFKVALRVSHARRSKPRCASRSSTDARAIDSAAAETAGRVSAWSVRRDFLGILRRNRTGGGL